MAKRKPYKEGDWFAVPVGQQFVLGRIARVGRRGGVLLGYFFGTPLNDVPTIEDTVHLTAFDAFNIGMFGDLGLVEDGWPIIPHQGSWNREDWPMPRMGRIVDLWPGLAFSVLYDEYELTACVAESPITVEQALQLPCEGMAGHIYLQRRMEMYFRDGPEVYDPSNRKKTHTWYHGLPKNDL